MRASTSAIVARNETWTDGSASEPYEAGWAAEAIVFIRALTPPDGEAGIAVIEISPDGMRWVAEGSRLPMPSREDEVTAARVSHFGTWLRVRAEMPAGSACRVLVTLHLKS
ncbi:hypothetical protein [Alsobacter sp. R-9]